MKAPEDGTTAEKFWDDTYQARERYWSGDPNPVLVELTGRLAPGRALDLGCGEGADAIWLARRGWDVTAVDVAQVALDRATEHASRSVLAGRIDWQRHDLARSFPAGSYDLVSAQFLHSPMEFPRDEILRRAASAVAADGILLVVGHSAFPPWAHDHDPTVKLPTPPEVRDAVALPEDAWRVDVCETREREATGPDGKVAALVDSVVLLHRLT